MTGAQIISRVREQSLISTTQFADADVLLLLNEGERFVSTLEKWPYLFTSSDEDYTAATREYDLSTDFSISDMAFIDQIVDKYSHKRRLIPISFQEYIDMYGDDPSSGNPRYYYLTGVDTLGLVPVPSATTTSSSGLSIYYYKTPTVMATTSASPEWTAQLHDLLVDYGLYRVWEREEYFDEATKAYGRFIEGVALMKRYYNMRTTDSPVVFGDGTWSRRVRSSVRDHLPFD
jgi:hypothetical protein